MTIYLYKKTHNKTGLKYLGKTIYTDPHKYKGSGKYWKLHIKKYGYDVTTDILKECDTKDEAKYWGLYYSTLWNIVDSNEWANLKPESGDGGGPPPSVLNNLKWHTTEAVSKRTGKNHYTKKPGYICKTAGDNNPMRRPEVRANRYGDNNPMRRPEISEKTRDQKIYTFMHDDGTIIRSTRYDFIKEYKITESNLSNLIKGKRKSVLGWRFPPTDSAKS